MPPPVHPMPVDRYDLIAVDGSRYVTLYFSMYFRGRSTKAPAGLTLWNWYTLKWREKALCKVDTHGSRFHLEDFPFGLPAAVGADPLLTEVLPELQQQSVAEINEILERNATKFRALMAGKKPQSAD